MSVLEIVFFSAKAFFVVMFAMNVGVILTWVDRRGGAMLQDRVGPERAVIWLPRPVARALVLLPALAVGGGIVAFAVSNKDEMATKTENAMWISHAAIFMTWLTALIIAGSVRRRGVRSSFDAFLRSFGDPRVFFYGGLGLHVGSILVGGLLRGTELGQTLRDLAYSSGAFVLAAAVVGGAIYSAAQMKDDKVGLRLAGLLHPAADGLKFAFKEDIIPPGADRFLHSIAPIISVFPVLVLLAVVPFGDTLCFGAVTAERMLELEQGGGLGAFYANLVRVGGPDLLQLAQRVPGDGICAEGTIAVPLLVVDLNVGILYFFALAGTGIVGAALAGWASDNKFSLLGGLRAASQMVSYEVTLGLTVIGSLMIYGTVQVDEMVRWQAENTWGIFVQPLAFVLFFAAAIAESKRIPFDLPEGESEIVSGYFTEYSGMKFSMFMFAEYVAVVTSAGLMVALFFGGWHLPFVEREGIRVAIGDTVLLTQPLAHGAVVLLGFLGFIVKTIMLCLVKMTIRWTLPRFRYDQLMRLGWRTLLPLSLINILVTGLVMLAIQSGSPSVASALAVVSDITEAIVAVTGIVAIVVLVRFLLKPAEHRRVLSSTSARFAAWAGGTKTAKLGA